MMFFTYTLWIQEDQKAENSLTCHSQIFEQAYLVLIIQLSSRSVLPRLSVAWWTTSWWCYWGEVSSYLQGES